MELTQYIQQKRIEIPKVPGKRESLAGRKVVFTNGVFDIVHRGHLSYLLAAAGLGDFLWIGLNSDASVQRLKGPKRPVNGEEDRLALLSCLSFVDAVTIFSDDTPVELVKTVKPDIYVKGADYESKPLPEREIVESYGGTVKLIKFVTGYSTSSTIDKIQEEH